MGVGTLVHVCESWGLTSDHPTPQCSPTRRVFEITDQYCSLPLQEVGFDSVCLGTFLAHHQHTCVSLGVERTEMLFGFISFSLCF